MTAVQLRIPNRTGTGTVWDDTEIEGIIGQTPLITNRNYILDKDQWGHVPLPGGDGVKARIVAAVDDGDTILLTLDVDNPEIAALLNAHGGDNPGWGYAAHQFGWDAPKVCEIGPAPEPAPDPPTRVVQVTVHYRVTVPADVPLDRLAVARSLDPPPIQYSTGAPDPDGGQGTYRTHRADDVDLLTYSYAFTEDPLLTPKETP